MSDARFQQHIGAYILILLALSSLALLLTMFGGDENLSASYDPLSAETQKVLGAEYVLDEEDLADAQQGFQYLVTISSGTLSPSILMVREGERVRFFNQSDEPFGILVAEDAAVSIPSGGFWEYSFENKGQIKLTNIEEEAIGTITVE